MRRIGTVVLWRPLEWFAGLDRRALAAGALTIALITIPAILVGGLIAKRGLQPLERIADIASEIEAHDLALRLVDVPDRADELGRLSVTFNRMLDRLQAAFERERRFTADASHELRAPLAVIAAETTLALRRDRDAASYRSTLEVVAEVTREFQTLVEDLLDVARNGDDSPRPLVPVDLADATNAAIDLLAPLSRERNVTMHPQLEPDVAVFGERTAIGRAFVAVLHNAIKFAPGGSNVHVTVSRDGTHSQFRVSDEGPGFSHDALAHALDRFWRADPARSPGSGTGLGLAIARAVVERYGGAIALENAAVGGNAAVTIRFPGVWAAL